jgi:hypothetical protein
MAHSGEQLQATWEHELEFKQHPKLPHLLAVP